MASRGFFGYDPFDGHYYRNPYGYSFPPHPIDPLAPARSAAAGFGFLPYYAGFANRYSYPPLPPFASSTGGIFPATGNVEPAFDLSTGDIFPTMEDIDSYYQHNPGGFFPAAGNVEPASDRSAGGFIPTAEDIDSYYQHNPSGFFPAGGLPNSGSSKSASIPVRFDGIGPEAEVARVPVKRAPSAEEAAVRLQAAVRGLLARRAVHELHALDRMARVVAERVARDAEALRRDARARIAVGEALMRLLLRLDAVRGARDYRRLVTRRVLALQDAVDALEPRPEPAAAAGELPSEAVVDENESDKAPAEAPAETEVDGDTADDEPCVAGETDQVADDVNTDVSECEWEIVTREAEATPEEEASAYPPHQEPAREDRKAEEVSGCIDGGLDAKKLMEMVAALYEQSAQQCAVIGALTERVDALERAVGRGEAAAAG